MEVSGRRFTVMGLGRHGGGVAAARWLAQQGAQVTVTDVAEAQSLASSVAALGEVPIAHWVLGRHDEADFADADAIVVNPAVRPNHPLLAIARAHGVPITSEIELFLDRCRAAVIGVSGSNGKSTTASMLAEVFSAAGRHAWLGGNIGVSLLGQLHRIQAADQVILELSSFQLAHLSDLTRFPTAAVMTNCTPNHLDWHGSWEAYVAAKRRLFDGLPDTGFAIFDPADLLVAPWPAVLRAKVVPPWPVQRLPPLAVEGEHNCRNAALAAAAAESLGLPMEAIFRGLRQFHGLAHRCEKLGQVAGRLLIDDSKSTTPEATRAALAACPGQVWLLLGGQDKGADFGPLLDEVARRAAGAACFGSLGQQLHSALTKISPDFPSCAGAICPRRLPGAGSVRPRATRSCFRRRAPVSINFWISSIGQSFFAV